MIDRQAYEERAGRKGFTRVAGVDEVARAAWAGPMVAAAVILGEDFDSHGIRSSKRMSRSKRQAAHDRIVRGAVAYAVVEVSAAQIDAEGIDTCHMRLLRDAVEALPTEPDYVLVDHYSIPGLRWPQQSISKGDDLSVSIAAASIIAKVHCDRLMAAFEGEYPGYGFAARHGYGSPAHREALDRLGPSAIHRRSVSPVRRALKSIDERNAQPVSSEDGESSSW